MFHECFQSMAPLRIMTDSDWSLEKEGNFLVNSRGKPYLRRRVKALLSYVWNRHNPNSLFSSPEVEGEKNVSSVALWFLAISINQSVLTPICHVTISFRQSPLQSDVWMHQHKHSCINASDDRYWQIWLILLGICLPEAARRTLLWAAYCVSSCRFYFTERTPRNFIQGEWTGWKDWQKQNSVWCY